MRKKKRKGFTAWFYREQARTDIGSNQIDWFISMGSNIALYLVFLDTTGFIKASIGLFALLYVTNVVTLNLLGRLFIWKGWYSVDRHTFANIDPVEKKKLKAAEIIIEKEERRRK